MESVPAGDDVGVRVRADHGVYMGVDVSDCTRIHEGLRIRPSPIRGSIVHVRPVGCLEACSRCSLFGSASVTPELGSFLVDGPQPPGQEQGGLVRRVYLCQVGSRGTSHGSWWTKLILHWPHTPTGNKHGLYRTRIFDNDPCTPKGTGHWLNLRAGGNTSTTHSRRT